MESFYGYPCFLPTDHVKQPFSPFQDDHDSPAQIYHDPYDQLNDLGSASDLRQSFSAELELDSNSDITCYQAFDHVSDLSDFDSSFSVDDYGPNFEHELQYQPVAETTSDEVSQPASDHFYDEWTASTLAHFDDTLRSMEDVQEVEFQDQLAAETTSDGVSQPVSDQLCDGWSASTLPQFDSTLCSQDNVLKRGPQDQPAEETTSIGVSTGAPLRRVLPPDESIGVTYHQKNKQWEAHLWVKDRQLGKRKKKGSQIFLGSYNSVDDAKAAHDRAALKLGVQDGVRNKLYPLNFSEAEQAQFLQEHADWTKRDFLWKIRRCSDRFSKGRSAMKGVSMRSRKGVLAYEAKISQTTSSGEKRTYSLGKHGCEDDAGRAYDRALLFLKGQDSDCMTNFRPSEYSAAEIEEARTDYSLDEPQS